MSSVESSSRYNYGVQRACDELSRIVLSLRNYETMNKNNAKYIIYKHNPPHLFLSNATYIITASTYKRKRFFHNDELKSLVLISILHYFSKYSWHIKAYVILTNHYHLLVHAPENNVSLSKSINNIHRYTAHKINQINKKSGMKIWWNYWDTCLTYEKSYYARLNYIHFNPVKHGYVDDPKKWKFSSYNEFCELDYPEAKKVEKEFPFDRVKVYDNF